MSTVQTREKAREKRLRDYFNLTVQEWEQIHEYQNRVCAICHTQQSSGKRLATDHSHFDIGLVRGLLCSNCNYLLGKIENALNRYPRDTKDMYSFRDLFLVTILQNISTYIQKPPCTAALRREVLSFPGRTGTKVHRKFLKNLQKNLQKNIGKTKSAN